MRSDLTSAVRMNVHPDDVTHNVWHILVKRAVVATAQSPHTSEEIRKGLNAKYREVKTRRGQSGVRVRVVIAATATKQDLDDDRAMRERKRALVNRQRVERGSGGVQTGSHVTDSLVVPPASTDGKGSHAITDKQPQLDGEFEQYKRANPGSR